MAGVGSHVASHPEMAISLNLFETSLHTSPLRNASRASPKAEVNPIGLTGRNVNVEGISRVQKLAMLGILFLVTIFLVATLQDHLDKLDVAKRCRWCEVCERVSCI